MKRLRLGELLVRRGIATVAQVEAAVAMQPLTGLRLASALLTMAASDERALLTVLTAQLGVPGVQLQRVSLPVSYLDVLSEQLARRHLVLPLKVEPERLFVAMADPLDESQIGELAFTSGRRVIVAVAIKSCLQSAIDQAYQAKRNGELEFAGKDAEGSSGPGASRAIPFVWAESLSEVPRELIDARAPEAPEILEDAPSSGSAATDAGDDSILVIIEAEVAPPQIPRGDESLAVASAPGPGDAQAPRAQRPSEVTPAVERTSVLVVDDDPELNQVIARLLQSKGFAVRTAMRGLEALTMIRREPPDLVILDAMLPEVHGFDICKKIKSSDRYRSISVIMISSIYRGWRFAQDLKDYYRVDAFLEKPFELNELWRTVDRVLGTRKHDRKVPARVSAAAKKAVQEGVKRFKVGDFDGAIVAYQEAIQIEPLSAKLRVQLANLYLKKKGMTYHAMQEFEEAVALEPELFGALRSLAILYQSKGFRSKAIEMWERAARCNRDAKTAEHIRNHITNLISRAGT